MKIYPYSNYLDYVKAQTEANVAKLDRVYVDKKTIESIVKKKPQARSVLCHGTRNAAEQKYFQFFLPQAWIVGTEISHTATQFEMTTQWDFHNVNPHWIGKFDIIYSNSFDHAMDPERALLTWKDQLAPNGTIFLEHSPHVQSRKWDPLEIDASDLTDLFQTTGLTIVDTYPSSGANGSVDTTVYELEKTL